MNMYLHRIIDEKVKECLEVFGAVCIEGPKWSGKTWTSRHHSQSQIYLGDPSGNFQNRNLALMDPSMVLDGDKPRLIDEWQEVPLIWDAVRYYVDNHPEKGQFLITGSSTPNRKGILHSGAGRIARVRMNTMSLFESGKSSGDVSLRDICDGNVVNKFTGEVSLLKLAEYIVCGGWPANVNMTYKNSAMIPRQYINAILNDDVNRLDMINRDIKKFGLLLRSLARNEATTVSNKTLKNDIKERDNNDIDDNTVICYLDIAKRLFLTDNILPFATRVRSSVRVKQAEKRRFVDPSLACALLGLTPEKLINDLNTFGFLFESLVERDLRIYSDSFNAKLFHYQDYKGKEIDAVLELENGDWIAIEIKLGANEIDYGADNLLSIKAAIEKDSDGGKPPKQLVVICGLSNAIYKRPDGVIVLPITALKN